MDESVTLSGLVTRRPTCFGSRGSQVRILSSRPESTVKIAVRTQSKAVDKKQTALPINPKTSEFLPKLRNNFGVRSGNLLSVGQAAKHLGVTDKTVTAWCESGKLPAVTVPYGTRSRYKISPQAVEWFLEQQSKATEAQKASKTGSQKDALGFWIRAMQRGTFTGRVYSPRTVDDYQYYANLYFSKRQEVTFEGLQAELMRIPVHQFAKREHYYKAIYCFARFLAQQGLLANALLERIQGLAPKRHAPPKRCTVDITGLEKLLNACESTQERLLVTLLAYTGLRASEACALRIGDIDLESRMLTVQCGKGGKRRTVGITNALAFVLTTFLLEYPKGSTARLLHNNLGKPMDRNGLHQRLARLGATVGVKASPHALRRAFVTINAGKGRSLVHLQRSCGHSDIKTTMAYCLTSEQEVIQAMQGWD